MKVRADQLLVQRGLAPSRARAQALILAAKVYVGETRIDKAGTMIAEDAAISVRAEDHPYVSRGGVKLAAAVGAASVANAGSAVAPVRFDTDHQVLTRDPAWIGWWRVIRDRGRG